MCPVGLLHLAKTFVAYYLEEENPGVYEMSNEPMELELHTTHPFFFVYSGLTYFYCCISEFFETTDSSSLT